MVTQQQTVSNTTQSTIPPGTPNSQQATSIDRLEIWLNALGNIAKISIPTSDIKLIIAAVRPHQGYDFVTFQKETGQVITALVDNSLPASIGTQYPWHDITLCMHAEGDVDKGLAAFLLNQTLETQLAWSSLISVASAELIDQRQKQQKPKRKKESLMTVSDYVSWFSFLNYHFRLNTLDDTVEVNGERIDDQKEARILGNMDQEGFKQTNRMRLAIHWHADTNRYNPIREYLSALQWDGADHIDQLAGCFKDKHNVSGMWLRRFFVGSVARIHEPTQNRMHVLDGPQGIGKSYYAKWVIPLHQYYIEGPINPDDKDCVLRLSRAWIWEVSELGATTRRSDRESLKAFLSREQVTVRKPYDRYDTVKPAITSFIGTVNNESGILSDPTGSRRFMIAHITDIDWSYTQLNKDQIWAQAFELYKAGEPWELTRAEAALAESIAADYQTENPLEDFLITRYKIDPVRAAEYEINQVQTWFMPTNTILDGLINLGWHEGSRKGLAMQLAATCTKLRLSKGRGLDPLSGKRVRGYYGIQP